MVIENINALIKARKKHESAKTSIVVDAKTDSKARDLLRQRINSLKTKFDTNVDGAVIHGRLLASAPITRQQMAIDEKSRFKPDTNSLDLAYMSFKPGLSSNQRLSIQQ